MLPLQIQSKNYDSASLVKAGLKPCVTSPLLSDTALGLEKAVLQLLSKAVSTGSHSEGNPVAIPHPCPH